MTFLDTWGLVCGIISTVAWCVSFYGQVYENWKYKSVEGFSFNYQVFNVCGYLFYSSYCTLGFFFHQQGAGTVVVSDLVFAYHSLLLVFIEGVQCFIYKRGKNRVSQYTIAICITLWLIVMTQGLFAGILKLIPNSEYFNPVSVMGYCKLAISFMKYAPAVYYNYKRKSTKGWSIFNILLDLVGGVFSFASGSIEVNDGLNVTKLILAITTVFFDIIFIIQHYCLYRKNSQFYEEEGNENKKGNEVKQILGIQQKLIEEEQNQQNIPNIIHNQISNQNQNENENINQYQKQDKQQLNIKQ